MADHDGGRGGSGGRGGGNGRDAGRARDDGRDDGHLSAPGPGSTQAQLRRFIKSRSYVPMHELRRRFDINGEADDVQAVVTRDGRFWVGLPSRECGFLAELVDRGEVGLELCHDPCVNMVVGVFAMRPVAR
jgi:hypothetical protein